MALSTGSAQPGRTTVLDAVNVLLGNIGEAPVNTLENEQVVEARVALSTLQEIHKEAQTRGYGWNTERRYPFNKDSLGEIPVPENVVRFRLHPHLWNHRLVQRGTRLYDRLTRSIKVGDDVAQVEADVVMLLPWDQCPESFNRYVSIRAARVFADRIVTSDALFRYTALDEQLAWAEVERLEAENERPNILHGLDGQAPIPTYDPNLGLRRSIGGGADGMAYVGPYL